MKRQGYILVLLLMAIHISCSRVNREDPPSLDPSLQAELATWLDKEGRSPDDYVLSLFRNHDVVFLGEQHRIRHNVTLVQSLAKPLYNAGVRVIATEFGRREDQLLIDSLVTAAEWHEDLARRIVFQQHIYWGYQEYVDVYRAAWALNRQLPANTPAFRIIGLNDSPDWSLFKSREDQNDPEIRKQVWRGGGEEHWAGVILESVGSGEKVLVHCGIHHAFTEYRQPIVNNGDFSNFDPNLRCGNHVFKDIGKRAVTVFLHAPWNDSEGYGSEMIYPADGIVDALMFATGPRPAGFDLNGTPFGRIRIEGSVYRHGYDDFKLSDFCDGWIYTMPISEYEGVTVIEGWVNEDNLEYARSQSPNPRYRNASIKKFNSSIARSANISRRWRHLR